ncbi:MAG: amidohydrolase [Terrimicrobiaceae bacterium]|nr:amidohydrolase [Terrimicrobiaceae bacterium]
MPLWHLLPKEFGRVWEPARLADRLGEFGIKACILHPSTCGWLLNSAGGRGLLELGREHRLAVYLPRGEISDWDKFSEFLGRWPDISFVLTGASWAEAPAVFALMEAHPRLHITLERFHVHYGIEELCARGWEDRILFATDAPEMSAGAHRLPVDYAQVSDAQRRKIAGGNLARLLGVAMPGEKPFTPADPLVAQAQNGRPLRETLYDFHMHIPHEGSETGGRFILYPRGGPSGVRPMLDRLGCRGGGFMSWCGPFSCDSREGNRCTLAALEEFPETFWGLGTFDPSHMTREEMIARVRELCSNPRFLGMKP